MENVNFGAVTTLHNMHNTTVNTTHVGMQPYARQIRMGMLYKIQYNLIVFIWIKQSHRFIVVCLIDLSLILHALHKYVILLQNNVDITHSSYRTLRNTHPSSRLH